MLKGRIQMPLKEWLKIIALSFICAGGTIGFLYLFGWVVVKTMGFR